MVNIFKEIEEGPKGKAFKGMCEISHAFMKSETANAEDELNKFLYKVPNFNDEAKFSSVDEVIKNGFNWYIIGFLYGRGGIHYLIKNNHYKYPDNQTPWQEISRKFTGQLSEGACLNLEESYFDIANSKGIPRDSH